MKMKLKDFIELFTESAKTFEGQEKGEEVVLLLRRHPFVALMPASTLTTVGVITALIFLAFYSYLAQTPYFELVLFLGSLYYLLLWLMIFYKLTMYTLNTVIVTDRRIIERDQNSFFDRKVSELHIYRIQDITVSTKGIIPTMLHYGDIVVQTAASEKEFTFHEMPNPEEVKNSIMRVVSMANAGVKPASEAVHN